MSKSVEIRENFNEGNSIYGESIREILDLFLLYCINIIISVYSQTVQSALQGMKLSDKAPNQQP